MKQLDQYVGRIVRLNQRAFRELAKGAKEQGKSLENCFLVAGVSREMRKLICYGANLRLIVGVSEIALI